MLSFFDSFCFGLSKIKLMFLSLIAIFSVFIIIGSYFGFTETAKVTEVALQNEETTSTIKTAKTTIETTIREFNDEETTSSLESTTTSTVLPGDLECEELGCPSGTNFVGSKTSDKYHYCSCSYAKSIKPENLVCFFTKEEAEEQEYVQSSCQLPSTTTTLTSTTSLTSISSTVDSTTTQETTSSTTTTINLPELSLNVIVETNPIVRGNNQTIITEVTYEGNFIENAEVSVNVTYASGSIKNCGNGLTNSSGLFVCTWKIGGGSTTGTFNVIVIAIKENFNLATKSTSFEVIPAS